MNAATVISAERRRAGLTQGELAGAAGTSQATVSAYESGRKQPSVATLSRLLAAAGARLVVESGRPPVRSPSRARHEAAAAQLVAVLALAAALPARHAPALSYPHLPARR